MNLKSLKVLLGRGTDMLRWLASFYHEAHADARQFSFACGQSSALHQTEASLPKDSKEWQDYCLSQ